MLKRMLWYSEPLLVATINWVSPGFPSAVALTAMTCPGAPRLSDGIPARPQC